VKQSVSPKVLFSIIAVVVVIVAVLAIRVFTAPSAAPAPGTEGGKPIPQQGQGGPTEADLKYMREYNAKNPGAATSRQ